MRADAAVFYDGVWEAAAGDGRGLFPYVFQPLRDDREDMGIQQGIVDCFSIPAVFDQAVLL